MSNTILNALDSKEDKLQIKLDNINDKINDAEKARDNSLNGVVKSYLEGIETDLIDIDYGRSYSYIELSCRGEEYIKDIWNEEKGDYDQVKKFRSQKLGTVYTEVNYDYPREGVDSKIIELGLGSYSSSKHNGVELDRFMYLGEVAKVIKDHGDDIVAEMNKIYDAYYNDNKGLTKKRSEIRREMEKVRTDRDNFKNDTIIRDLENGIKITSDNLPYIQARFDWGVGSIVGAKITRKSYSGKSMDLELTRKGRKWNDKTETYDNYTYKYDLDKVRKSNVIDAFVNSYNGIKWDLA